MKLTFTSALAVYTLAQTVVADHALQGCWRLAGTSTNAQVCSYVDITSVGECMLTQRLRSGTEAYNGVRLAGRDDLVAVKVYQPYTCYFFTNPSCSGNVGGNRLATNYIQMLGGADWTNIYPHVILKSFRCDKT